MNDGNPTAVVAGHLGCDVLVVRGPEAVSYLQGQVSADVVTLEPGQSTLALLLEPTGKLEAVLRLWRTDENVVLIDTDRGAGDEVEARLRRFLLRTDATIERLEWDRVVIRGPGATRWSDRLVGTGAELVGLGMWPGVEGLDLLGPDVEVPGGLDPASPELLESMRITAGWPAPGSEVVPGVIPAEIGPWLITAAVSFDKGCYVGQELTARIDSRGGNVPRRLRSFELDEGRSVVPGHEIVDEEGSPVGTVTSAAEDPRTGRFVVCGYVRRAAGDSEALSVRPAQ